MPKAGGEYGVEAEASYVSGFFLLSQGTSLSKVLCCFFGRSTGTAEAKLLAGRGLSQQYL